MNNKIIFILAVLVLFISCNKESTNSASPDNTSAVAIKYMFTSNLSAEYRIAYKQDSLILDEIILTQAWSKTVNVPGNSTSKIARLSVYPPDAWVGTGTQANINIKLFIDGMIKKDTSGILAGFDRASGITVQTTY